MKERSSAIPWTRGIRLESARDNRNSAKRSESSAARWMEKRKKRALTICPIWSRSRAWSSSTRPSSWGPRHSGPAPTRTGRKCHSKRILASSTLRTCLLRTFHFERFRSTDSVRLGFRSKTKFLAAAASQPSPSQCWELFILTRTRLRFFRNLYYLKRKMPGTASQLCSKQHLNDIFGCS